MNGSLSAARLLDDVVLLNRTVYGGADDLLPAFLNDYDPARDPDAVGLRTALNVYDRYDSYLDPLGFTTLSSADLGFDPANVGASETNAGRDLNFTYAGDLYRNNFQQMDNGSLVAYEGAGAVALAAIKDTGASKTLHLVFRGTDADGPTSGAIPDGEAGEGLGQVRYYRQLKPLIDQALAFASDPANGVTDVVVSGHSLGGLMADMFALYDGAAFDALPGVSLQVIALASAGVDPKTLTLMPGYDPSLVNAGPEGVTFNTPPWYAQYDHSEDIVRNPERYDGVRHAQTDPEQAPVTQAAVSTLVEHIHFEGSRFEIDAPLIDQYEISADRQTNFLAEHYSSFYELVGTGFSEAAARATHLDYDRFVTLNGTNERLVGTSGDNNVNGWAVPIDDTFDDAAAADDLFVIGLNGDDRITTGGGSDLIDGGDGNDALVGGGGADRLIGGDGVDGVAYDTSAAGVTVFLNARSGEGGDAEGDTLVGIERVFGSAFADRLTGASRADVLVGMGGGDVLRGGGGNDRLNGGAGNDLLVGDAGADTFAFSAGADRVRAYEDGPDRIDLRHLDLADGFADLLVTQSGASTLVRVDADGNGRPEGSASLTLIDMDRSLITAGDFLF